MGIKGETSAMSKKSCIMELLNQPGARKADAFDEKDVTENSNRLSASAFTRGS